MRNLTLISLLVSLIASIFSLLISNNIEIKESSKEENKIEYPLSFANNKSHKAFVKMALKTKENKLSFFTKKSTPPKKYFENLKAFNHSKIYLRNCSFII